MMKPLVCLTARHNTTGETHVYTFDDSPESHRTLLYVLARDAADPELPGFGIEDAQRMQMAASMERLARERGLTC